MRCKKSSFEQHKGLSTLATGDYSCRRFRRLETATICRRSWRQSPKTATNGDSTATVAEFGDCSRQCGQGLRLVVAYRCHSTGMTNEQFFFGLIITSDVQYLVYRRTTNDKASHNTSRRTIPTRRPIPLQLFR